MRLPEKKHGRENMKHTFTESSFEMMRIAITPNFDRVEGVPVVEKRKVLLKSVQTKKKSFLLEERSSHRKSIYSVFMVFCSMNSMTTMRSCTYALSSPFLGGSREKEVKSISRSKWSGCVTTTLH